MPKIIKTLFFIQIALFVSSMLFLFTPIGELFLPGGMVLLAIFSIIGLAFIILVRRKIKEGKLRKIFLVNGFSAFGLLFFSILHNFMYALGEMVTGNALEKIVGIIGGGFFILSVVVCPVIFLVTTIMSIIYFRKNG
jgi:predicted ferric reductase